MRFKVEFNYLYAFRQATCIVFQLLVNLALFAVYIFLCVLHISLSLELLDHLVRSNLIEIFSKAFPQGEIVKLTLIFPLTFLMEFIHQQVSTI